MSSSAIRGHSFDRHHRAVVAIDAAIRKLDTDLRALARRSDLYPGERQKRESEIRATGATAVNDGRKALAAAVREDRESARYAEEAPSGEDLTRRLYYATQAASELAGLDARDAMVLVQSVAESGDHERAREYVRASRGVLSKSDAGAWRALEMKVEPKEAKMHKSFAASVDAVEQRMSHMDKYVGESAARAGQVSEAEKEGREDPDTDPMMLRQLHLWLTGAREDAVKAFDAKATEQEGPPAVEPGLPAAL